MDKMIEEIKNIDAKLDKTLEAVHDAQVKAEEIGAQAAKTDTTVKEASEASAKAMEEVQEMKTQIQAVEKTAIHIESMITRMPGTSDNEQKELEARCREEMIGYLRKKTPLSPEVVEATARVLTMKGLHGVSDQVRELEMKDLMAGSNPDGGYWIRPERSAMMIKRIFETSAVRGIANVQSTNTDSVEFIIDDNEASSGGWVGETDARGETATPKIGKLTIPIHEQFAQPKATQKMLDDAGFDIEAWLSNNVQRKMTRTENTAFVLGDGSQKPQGFLTLPAWAAAGVYERGALEQVVSGTNGTFVADTIKLLQTSLIEEYQANAVFALQRISWQQITTLKGSDNEYLLDPRSMKIGDTLTLLGRPVMFMNDIPGAATDSLSMVYGDFSMGYTVIDRIGFRVIRDNLTNKPNVKFYTTKRTGGAVTNFESIKVYKLATS